jgi:regulator of sigma E protease
LTTGNPGWIWTIAAFLLVIGPLVFIHELGHYFVGRWFGVKADVFSIGFGREIAGWTDKRDTRWKIGWLPLGGYVRFAGDMNAAGQPSDEWLSLPAEERNRTFQAKPLWQRSLIVLAGPVTNLLFAVLVACAFLLAYGQYRSPPVVDVVEAGSAAQVAGLSKGDRILAVGGTGVDHFEDIGRLVVLHQGEPLRIAFERGGRSLETVATPKDSAEEDRFGNKYHRGKLGIKGAKPILEPVPPLEIVPTALKQTWYVISVSVEAMGQIITGRRSLREMGGPLQIAKLSGEHASLGFIEFVGFVALISINLGFINLLPIPLLDGGHLLFYAIEGVRRKPLKPEAQEWAFKTGLAALLALMIFVTLNDLASFGLWSKLGGLIG